MVAEREGHSTRQVSRSNIRYLAPFTMFLVYHTYVCTVHAFRSRPGWLARTLNSAAGPVQKVHPALDNHTSRPCSDFHEEQNSLTPCRENGLRTGGLSTIIIKQY